MRPLAFYWQWPFVKKECFGAAGCAESGIRLIMPAAVWIGAIVEEVCSADQAAGVATSAPATAARTGEKSPGFVCFDDQAVLLDLLALVVEQTVSEVFRLHVQFIQAGDHSLPGNSELNLQAVDIGYKKDLAVIDPVEYPVFGHQIVGGEDIRFPIQQPLLMFGERIDIIHFMVFQDDVSGLVGIGPDISARWQVRVQVQIVSAPFQPAEAFFISKIGILSGVKVG